MKTRTVNTYTYAELSDKAKETARDWFRKGFTFNAEFTIDDAKRCFAFCGLEISQVYWSGFSSQGDGACFEGSWRASRVNSAGLKKHAPTDTELHRIADGFAAIAAKSPHASFTVKHSGHYYHEYETAFTVSIVDENEDEIHGAEAEEAEKSLIEIARAAMKWTYRQLEKEDEYQNGDEQIAETIEANEYEFTEEGRRSVTL